MFICLFICELVSYCVDKRCVIIQVTASLHLAVSVCITVNHVLHLLFHPTINVYACLLICHYFERIFHWNVWFIDNSCICSIPEQKATTQACSTRVYNIYVLTMLLLTYLVNQLDRFLLGIVTKPMSQELGYGDWACMRNESVTKNAVICNATSEDEYVCSALGFYFIFIFHPSTWEDAFRERLCGFFLRNRLQTMFLAIDKVSVRLSICPSQSGMCQNGETYH